MTDRERGDTTEAQTHELKTWPDYFSALLDGSKTFEYRRDDRGFRVGDELHLREWEPMPEGRYTGREMRRRVTYILPVSRDFVVMALASRAAQGETPPEPTIEELHAVPGWFQIQAGSELSRLVEIVRFAPGQATGFMHNSHEASNLLWRWALKWFTPKGSTAPAEPPARAAAPQERESRRSIAELRAVVSMLCHFVWHRQLRPGEHMWSIPVDRQRDFDCILSDAIDELEQLRAAPQERPTHAAEGQE